ncbi:MAG TPA: LCP family protein [Acidimicrobiia bacterium]|jgi:LCP family protein required for cell wall assembly
MKLRTPVVRLIAIISLSGLLMASVVSAAWLAWGPTLPAGAAFLRVERVSSSQFTGAPNRPFFFLALGNDSREPGANGLGDSIHVIGINPATKQGTMLNVPRDTEAPDGGKINSYHSQGGLPGFVDQLNKMMGIHIDYAITTDFPRFINMVNAIGGIAINLPYDLTDGDYSGSDFRPGQQGVDGDQALAIARDRHDFERQGDRQRTWNAGLVILSALATLRSHQPSAEDTVQLIATLISGVTTDNVSPQELFHLGRLALSIDPANISNCTIPTGGGAGTNLGVAPEAAALFADFADDGVAAFCDPVPGGLDLPSPG